MPKPHCNVPLTIVVPLSAKGYADGIYCMRPRGHASRIHEATHRGSSNESPAMVSIKWSDDAPE